MARGNPWFSAVEQTLPTYVPLPFEQLAAAGQAVQGRYDTAMNTLDQTATGLASIEARLPGHQQYVTDYANRFNQEAEELLTRYNNNAADPQFMRELTRLRNRYVNDPNLRIITMANEADKRNQELAARMAAEGRLFINPRATGVDAQGRLINDVGQIRGVNTLDQYRERLKMAAQSKTEYGNMIGNRPQLEQARAEILAAVEADAPEIQDLRQAYISQGLSPEQANNQIVQDIQRLSGEYAIEEGTNWQRLNYESAERDRVARRQAAAQKAQQAQIPVNGTYFVPTFGVEGRSETNPYGTNIIPERVRVNDIEMPIAGKMNIDPGTKWDKRISGDIIKLKEGTWNSLVGEENKRTNESVYLKNGRFDSVQVPYMIEEIQGDAGKHSDKVGTILSQDKNWNLMWGLGKGTSSNLDILIEPGTGRPFAYIDDDKKIKAYLKPQAYAVYQDLDDDATYYKKLNRDETLRYLGPQAGPDGGLDVIPNAFNKLNTQQQSDVLMLLQQRGVTPDQKTLDRISTQLLDYNYYQEKIAPEFAKPSTTTNPGEYAWGE